MAKGLNSEVATQFPALSPSRTTPERWLGYIGWLFSAMAMGAQASFGVALMDYYLFRHLNAVVRAVLDILFFICIEESKRRVVTDHSEENFRGLARVEWRGLLNPLKWHWRNVLWQIFYNIPITFGGMHVFVAITGMSLDIDVGAASILKSYEDDAATDVANVINHRAFQITFMTAAALVNILLWPVFNEIAWNRIKYLLRYPLESVRFRALKIRLITDIESRRQTLKRNFENSGSGTGGAITRNLEDVNGLLQDINAVCFDPKTIYAELKHIPSPLSIDPKNTAEIERSQYLLNLTAFVLTTIGATGFWNIYGLGGQPATEKIAYVLTGKEHEPYNDFAPVTSVLSYLAIITLVVALIPNLTLSFPRHRTKSKKAYIPVSSRVGRWANIAKATVICLLGTTPNVYQAAQLLHQSWPFVVGAAMGSFLIEFQAAHDRCQPFNAGANHFLYDLLNYGVDFFAALTGGRGCNRRNQYVADDGTLRLVHSADHQLIALQDDPHRINTFAERYFQWEGKATYRDWVYHLFGRCVAKQSNEQVPFVVRTSSDNSQHSTLNQVDGSPELGTAAGPGDRPASALSLSSTHSSTGV